MDEKPNTTTVVKDASRSVIENATYANDFQQKVEMYLLALTFTVAGLAIQSAKFSDDHLQWALEIGGWVCLIVAAIISLQRMKYVPAIFRAAADQHQQTDMWRDTQSAPPEMKFVPEKQVLDKPSYMAYLNANIREHEKKSEHYRTLVQLLRTAQEWSFCAGIVLVAASRAYNGLFVTCVAPIS